MKINFDEVNNDYVDSIQIQQSIVTVDQNLDTIISLYGCLLNIS